MRKGVETRLDGSTLVVRIPMRFQRRGGRKRIVAPDGSELAPTTKPQPDGTLVKALARAWRWQRMLEEGRFASVSEIGDAENISKSYVSRILRLALLAPDIVEAILAERTSAGLMLAGLERPLPADWGGTAAVAQRTHVQRAPACARCPACRCRPLTPPSIAFKGPGLPRSIFYFLVSAFAAPGFGLAGAFGTVEVDARIFFLSALGFLASRLLLF
jgi:hypothetical protein